MKTPDIEAVREPASGEACHCQDCNPNARWMIVCDKRGNKRCPHAAHHINECTNSNASDQPLEYKPRPQNRLAECLEGPGRTREEMVAERCELDRVAPTPADKFALMFRGTMSERPTPLTDQQSIRPESAARDGSNLVVTSDFARELERQLAAATEKREQMGKQAHASACEAMEYRRQRDAYAETLREFLSLCVVYQKINSEHLEGIIRERHPELAGNIAALPPSVGSGQASQHGSDYGEVGAGRSEEVICRPTRHHEQNEDTRNRSGSNHRTED